jgi:hypothetical protein
MPDALSDQIPFSFRQAGKNPASVDELEAEKGMIFGDAVIKGAKIPQLLESAQIMKEGQSLGQGQILSLHAQRSGDSDNVLADPAGVLQLEINVLFHLWIPAMEMTGITIKPSAAEREAFRVHVRISGTIECYKMLIQAGFNVGYHS